MAFVHGLGLHIGPGFCLDGQLMEPPYHRVIWPDGHTPPVVSQTGSLILFSMHRLRMFQIFKFCFASEEQFHLYVFLSSCVLL